MVVAVGSAIGGGVGASIGTVGSALIHDDYNSNVVASEVSNVAQSKSDSTACLIGDPIEVASDCDSCSGQLGTTAGGTGTEGVVGAICGPILCRRRRGGRK